MVFPLAAIESINGIRAADARLYAQEFQYVMRSSMRDKDNRALSDNANVLFAEALDVPDIRLTSFVGEILLDRPDAAARLIRQAKKHDANSVAYAAAHLLINDTQAHLVPLNGCNEPEAASADRIISIGAQSERPFYAARMACRAALEDGNNLINLVPSTGQLFTRHTLPPYMACNEGEPDLYDVGALLDDEISHPVPSVRRDLEFLHQRVPNRLQAKNYHKLLKERGLL